jgi:hypothetical protein
VREKIAKRPWAIAFIGKGGKKKTKYNARYRNGYGKNISKEIQPKFLFFGVFLFKRQKQDEKKGSPQPNI